MKAIKRQLTMCWRGRGSLLVLAGVLVPWWGHGQATAGYSGQTQPSTIIETQFIRATSFDSARAAPRQTPMKVDKSHVKTVPVTGIAIDDATKLLTEYDDYDVEAETRLGLGHWLVGVVSDGDFNKNAASSTVSSAKAGSLGIDALWVKPVYYTHTYYHYKSQTAGQPVDVRKHEAADRLVGEQTINHPLFAFNALAVLLSGTGALATDIAAGAPHTAAATLARQRAFGQALLIPNGYVSGNGLSFTVNGTYYFGVLGPSWPVFKNLGLTGGLNVVQTNWATRDTAVSINILASSIGFNYRLIEGHFKVGEQENYVQVQPFVRYSSRYLFGDIEHQPLMLHDAIGTTRRDFHAIDLGVTCTVNAIRFTFNVPVFRGATIPGFTGGQPILGFGLAAAIRLTD